MLVPDMATIHPLHQLGMIKLKIILRMEKYCWTLQTSNRRVSLDNMCAMKYAATGNIRQCIISVMAQNLIHCFRWKTTGGATYIPEKQELI